MEQPHFLRSVGSHGREGVGVCNTDLQAVEMRAWAEADRLIEWGFIWTFLETFTRFIVFWRQGLGHVLA